MQGTKLYYRVLESMLKMEESRTGKRNFTALLTNDTFHTCLLACAFEMVVASYRIVSLFAAQQTAAFLHLRADLSGNCR